MKNGKGFARIIMLCAAFASGVMHARGADTCTLTIERNTYFADGVTVTSDKSEVSSGIYPVGAVITLEATSAEDGTFKKWYGDVAKEDRTKTTITFTLTEDRWIYARFVHPWTLATDMTTMTDGNFTVNVTNVSVKSHTLDVGMVIYKGTSPQPGATLLADDCTGSGVLDLGGTIMLEGDDVPWTITRFAPGKGSQTVSTNHTGAVATYISPGTVTIGSASQLFHCGDSSGGYGKSYETIIIDEPDLESFFTGYMMTGQNQVDTLICELPKVKSVVNNQVQVFYSLKGGTDTRFKFDWWDISSISSMTNTFFTHQWGGNHELYSRLSGRGTLALPSMRGIDWVSGGGTQLYMMPNVECISLGGATYETTVTNLGIYAFAGNTSLKKLVLHAAPDMQVGTRIFTNHTWNAKKTIGEVAVTEEIDGVTHYIGSRTFKGRVPDVIHFTGQAISSVAISNLLADVASVSTAEKPVTILASKYQKGWAGAEWLSSATADERAAYPGETVIGVYRENADAPSGKAVVLHRTNDWDEIPGFMMIFR